MYWLLAQPQGRKTPLLPSPSVLSRGWWQMEVTDFFPRGSTDTEEILVALGIA